MADWVVVLDAVGSSPTSSLCPSASLASYLSSCERRSGFEKRRALGPANRAHRVAHSACQLISLRVHLDRVAAYAKSPFLRPHPSLSERSLMDPIRAGTVWQSKISISVSSCGRAISVEAAEGVGAGSAHGTSGSQPVQDGRLCLLPCFFLLIFNHPFGEAHFMHGPSQNRRPCVLPDARVYGKLRT